MSTKRHRYQNVHHRNGDCTSTCKDCGVVVKWESGKQRWFAADGSPIQRSTVCHAVPATPCSHCRGTGVEPPARPAGDKEGV